MNQIKTIAFNTYLETIRDRILYIFVAFAVLLIGSSWVMGSISLDQDHKIIQDFGLAGIFFFSVLIAIFVGANSIYKEKDKRTIYIILSKPVRFYQFVVGKFLGLCLTLAVTTILMAIVLVLIIYLKDKSFSPLLLEAVGFGYLESILLIAVVLAFSSFTSPISAAVYTICLFIIGHSSSVISQLATKSSNVILAKLLQAIYFIFPNLEKFNLRSAAIFDIHLSLSQTLCAIGYGLFYTILMLFLASLILRKQEF